ncbi:MAG: tetratricopeptide repeat protein [Nitrosomonadales bacterium]|nr:tetratricopeptide repeat protein [Nitrosomonadales bacterium]
MHQNARYPQAQALCRQILQIQPGHFDALHLMGVIAIQTKDPARAIELIGKAIETNPQDADAYCNLGAALRDLRQNQAALESYDKAIALRPDHANVYYNRGNALQDLKRYQAALESYDKAIALRPGHANTYDNRGNTLRDLKQYQAALKSYDRAIALRPDHANAYNNRGNTLRDLRQHQAALESYEKAIALKPDFADACNNRGALLQDLRQYQAALKSYDKAIALKPDHAEAHSNRGDVLRELKQYPSALKSYDKAIALLPGLDSLRGMRLYTQMHICDWDGLEDRCKKITEKIGDGELAAPPFPLLAMSDSPALQRKAAELYVRDKYPASLALPEIHKHSGHDKIRIGYFSADYHNHATSYLMAELFEIHDKTRFELIAFSFGPSKSDEMRARVAAAFDQFIDVQARSDEEVAQLSRNLEIDIAIDLKGYTQDHRAGIFAARAAPVQVNYLGYPGTMGAPYMDYLIADRTLVPETGTQDYSEKIVYLPNSYQVNDSSRRIADRQYTRAELGLPQTGFVFCCFNNNFKITPDIFDAWMRILGQVENSVLWLFEDNPWVAGNLRGEATRRGIDAERLVFAARMPLPEHLARHRLADLFLDTLPYNAHTTASDALWVGLPVLTCMDATFAGRVAASLLNALHLPELITTSRTEYETLAITLASDPARLGALREKLARNLSATPLFDARLFARHIEAAYIAMYQRCQADLPPEHIYVPA